MAHHQYQQPEEHENNNPKFLLDTVLYCSEENWEEQDEYSSDDDDDSLTTIINSHYSLLEADMFWDEEELTSMLAKEEANPLCTYPASRREEAVEWMLKVTLHHSFSALTLLLAVNYLDRFLFSFRFQNEKPWLTHLAAVTCLSLAAKVEETQVPLSLDLQFQESGYLFEAKTIKKMEILVLSTLRWKMNPITPLSFVDYIIRRLGLKDHLCCEFLKRCETLLLSVLREYRFMSYLPSVLATATMLHVVDNVELSRIEIEEYQSQILGILGIIKKEKVDECCNVMLEYSELQQGKKKKKQCMKRKFRSNNNIPGSPNGVIDVSFSSSCDNNSVSSSVSSSPEVHLSKKIRMSTTYHQNQQQQLVLH